MSEGGRHCCLGRRSAPPFRPAAIAEPNWHRTFVDLGKSPLCESFLGAEQLDQGEVFYPLHVRICEECLLVQLEAYVPGEEIFRDYAYFSSYSDSWGAHAGAYTAQMVERFGLGAGDLVVELASNDGYLLRISSSAAFPPSASIPPPTSPRPLARRASRRSSTSSTPDWPTTRRRRTAPEPDRGQQRARARSPS
jgi:hypothetical protein